MSVADDGTIDITDAVEAMRSTFVIWAENMLETAIVAVPYLGWLAYPVIKIFFGAAIKWCLNKLSKTGVMGAMFLNTALRKPAQAKDFTSVVAYKNSLPKDVSDETYKNAESAQIIAFDRFVRVSN